MKMKGIKTVFSYAWKSKKEMILTMIFMSVGTISITMIPRIAESLINGIVDKSVGEIVRILSLGFLIAIGGSVIQGLGRLYSAKMGTMAQYRIREDVYHAINRQNFKYFDMNETGDLVSRATSDIETTTPVFNMGITVSIQALITLVGVILGISLMVPVMVWIYLAVLSIFGLILKYSAEKMAPEFYKSRISFGQLTSTFRENLIGAPVVRIFNSQQKELNKFSNHNDTFKEKSIITIKWHNILRYSSQIIIGILTIVSLSIGGKMVIEGDIEIGTLIGFMSYIMLLGMPLRMMNMVVMNVVQADAAMNRILEILEAESDVIQTKNPKRIKSIRGDVEFKNIYFSYFEDKPVLKNINFKVQAGETVAILGTTGSGKSTLIKLIPRYYELPNTLKQGSNDKTDPEINGKIYIDGTNVQKFSLEDLRARIGYCSQDIFLFDINIADNIRFGRPNASMNEVINAAKSANIHEFIQTLPNGYDTVVGERGTTLSGGQKQRIAIARALILDPNILILDAFTSAVDTETEYKIQQALENVMKGRTSFLITQRVSNLRNADKILVMDQGKIIAQGKHEELYNKNELYTGIFDTMFEKHKEAEYIMRNKDLETIKGTQIIEKISEETMEEEN